MKKILVIEDDPLLQENIKELLVFHKYEVETAENGLIGIAKALIYEPNLVICDVLMPGIDGFDTLASIRQNALLQEIPFIFLTGLNQTSDFRKAMLLGADDYLTKPVNETDLITTIEAQLKKRELISNKYTKEISTLTKKVDKQRSQIEKYTYLSNHNVRGPLARVMGLASLLMGKCLEMRTQEDVEILQMLEFATSELDKVLRQMNDTLETE